MQLDTVQIRKFQNIVDSTEVDVDSDILCLVGKNESGKTAFLEALRRLNPSVAGKEFVPRDHYPRWRWKRDQRKGEVAPSVPVEATFKLEDNEIEEVEEKFGEDIFDSSTIRVWRNYSNELSIEPDVDEISVLRNLALRLPEGSKLRNDVSKKQRVESFKDAWGQSDANPDDRSEAIGKIENLIDAPTVARGVGGEMSAMIPKFFYFSQYSQLPGRISLSRLLRQASDNELGDEESTAYALLKLAGGREEDLKAEDYEQRVAELESSANLITQDVLEYWSQNDQLRVELDVDKVIEEDKSGNKRVEDRYLEVRLNDLRHMFTTNFERRSSGFRWFFSFTVAFSQFRKDGENVIVLLDEPGLNLHARAQEDFLRFIDEDLGSRHQVIYTTHSPFMIEPSKLGSGPVVC